MGEKPKPSSKVPKEAPKEDPKISKKVPKPKEYRKENARERREYPPSGRSGTKSSEKCIGKKRMEKREEEAVLWERKRDREGMGKKRKEKVRKRDLHNSDPKKSE